MTSQKPPADALMFVLAAVGRTAGFQVKVQGRRVEAEGQPSAEHTGQHATSGRGESAGGSGSSGSYRLKTARSRIHETPEGATPTALYEMYERAPKIMMLTTPEAVDEK